MLRNADWELMRSVGGPLWLLLEGAGWPTNHGERTPTGAAASAVLAHLAYCTVGEEEREDVARATVVPSKLFQQLVAQEQIDLVEAFRRLDLPGVEIVRTRRYVALAIAWQDLILVAVRGTVGAYEWAINLNVVRSRDALGRSVHTGFFDEACLLARDLKTRLQTRFSDYLGRPNCAIYLSGHSLGGAVVALMKHMDFPAPVHDSYIFGSPRVGPVQSQDFAQPFATRRDLDIVPHCPPRFLGYEDFRFQSAADGSVFVPATGLELAFFASWIVSLALRRFSESHSMERYRFEATNEARRDPVIGERWHHDWIDPTDE